MIIQKTGNRVSLIVVSIISIIILFCHFNLPRLKYPDGNRVLTFDVASYYLYLPMSLIHKDPGMKTAIVDSLQARYKFSPTLYQVHTTENRTRVPNYTCGMSYFYLPFFLIGHIWALNSDYPADGFSHPYNMAISLGIYLFIIPGLFLLRKFLIQFFSDTVVSLSLIILFIGTNYFSEAVGNALQPHPGLFALYVILLYYTKQWHDSPSYRSAAIIGFVTGWLTLARPTDIISIFIPILWGVSNRITFLNKLNLLQSNFLKDYSKR